MPNINLETEHINYYEANDIYSQPYLESLSQSQWASSLSPVVEAKFSVIDLSLLLFMWLVIFASSIKSFGFLPAALFLAINIFLVIRNPLNGFLVLVLIFFTPVSSLLIPRPFVVSSVILVFGYIIKGNISNLSFLNTMTLMALGFVVYIGLTGFFSQHFEIFLIYLQDCAESLIFLILIFSAIQTSNDLGVLLKWLSIVAAISIFITATHCILGPSTVQYQLTVVKVGEETLTMLGRAVLGGERVRLLWPGLDPNYFAAQLIFPLAVSLGLFSITKGVFRKFLWILICLVIIGAILGTFSRSGYLSTLVLLVLFVGKRNLRALVPALAISLAFFYLLSVVPVIQERIASIPEDIVRRGAAGRFYAYQASFKLWLASPVWGQGVGSVLSSIGLVTHNTFLQILAELGLIGEIFFVGVIVLAVKSIRAGEKLYLAKSTPDVILFGIILLGLIATCLQFCTVTLNDPMVLWLLCGICGVFCTVKKREVLTDALLQG